MARCSAPDGELPSDHLLLDPLTNQPYPPPRDRLAPTEAVDGQVQGPPPRLVCQKQRNGVPEAPGIASGVPTQTSPGACPGGYTGTSRAPRRQTRGGRSAARGSLLCTTWTSRSDRASGQHHLTRASSSQCRKGSSSGRRLTPIKPAWRNNMAGSRCCVGAKRWLLPHRRPQSRIDQQLRLKAGHVS